MEDLNTFLENLAVSIRDGGLAVFCGAGISRNSRLPTVNEFLPEIFASLRFRSLDPQMLSQQIPFEAVMEQIQWGGDITRLLDVFDGASPNATHFLLADLAAKLVLTDIVTTNFDRLIEAALDEVGVDYSIASDTTEFASINWDAQRVRVTKIHGSVESKATIVATLRTVAQRSLSSARRLVIERLFRGGRHSHILILGYSCSDVFDLSPAFAEMADTDKQIILVEHSDLERARIEPLAVKQTKNPFLLYKTGLRVYYDTNVLVSRLYQLFGFPSVPRPQLSDPAVDWKSVVKDWLKDYDSLGGVNVKAVEGKLLLLAQRPADAVVVLAEAASLASNGNTGQRGDILNHLGLAYDRAERYTEAIRCFHDAISDFREVGDVSREAQAVGNLGSIFALKGQYAQALEAHASALHLAREARDRHTEETQLGSLALVARYLRRYDESVALHQEAISLAEELGNVHSACLGYGNLGITYRYLKQYEDAEFCHERALRLAVELGDRVATGNQLGNLGLIYSAQGKFEYAMQHHVQALAIAESVSDRSGMATQLANIGFVSSKLHNFEDAVKFHLQALAIEKALGRKAGIARELDNLAGAYCALSQMDKAAESGEAALELYKQLYGIDDNRSQELIGNLNYIYDRMQE